MKVHLIGIGGTGMGAVAGLLVAQGHDVRGSDVALYPPMSDQLAMLGVTVMTPYAAANLAWQPDVVVVGNVHGKDHVEVVAAQALGLTLTSFPRILGEQFLAQAHSIVVAGTHGKTTTTALLAHILTSAGRDPGYFVGGVPIATGVGYHAGRGTEFVVEGDEYDTAFFDKGSKFLHYRPTSAILTSIELDHVDIFADFSAVRAAFQAFVRLLPGHGVLVAAENSPAVRELVSAAPCKVELYGVAATAETARPSEVVWWATSPMVLKSGRTCFDVYHRDERIERFETMLGGHHNVANCVAAIAIAMHRKVAVREIVRGLATFAGVKRRQEFRGVAGGVTVIDDYGHHPTAVRETLRSMRARFPTRRLIAIYDPRSATSRRNTFQQEFVDALAVADEVIIGKLYDPSKIPETERFNPETLAIDLHRGGTKAIYSPDVATIVEHVRANAGPGDVVCVLSSGAFENVHDRMLDAIGDAMRPAKRGDMATIRAILAHNDLGSEPATDDLFPNYFTLRNERGVVGCVALEVYGEDGVLRSLAVESADRGAGYGWMLAELAIEQARYRGVRRIYVLTAFASDFFAAKFGFRIIDRSTLPEAIAQSPNFTAASNEPGRNVIAMRLDL